MCYLFNCAFDSIFAQCCFLSYVLPRYWAFWNQTFWNQSENKVSCLQIQQISTCFHTCWWQSATEQMYRKKKEAHETAVHHCSVESSPIYFCKNFLNIYYMYKERFALSYISVTVNLEESVSIFSVSSR